MRKINVALCSFGMSGWVFHAPFLQQHPGFHFYGVLERSKNLAAGKFPEVITFRSLDALLEDKNIDLVIVNTPNATHYEFAKKALLAGKHVVVEKPFTVDPAEAEELISLASRQQKKLAVYQNRRWDSDFLTVSAVARQGVLGEIVEAEFHFDRYKPELSPKLHKETPGPGAGALYDLGSHLVDQALHLFGMPEAVFADIRIVRPVSQVDDYFELLLYYPSLRVRLKGTYLTREALPAYSLQGSQGSFIKSRADVQEAALQAGIQPGSEGWGIEPGEERGLLHTTINGNRVRERIDTVPGNYMNFYNGLHESITSAAATPVPAEDGLKTIRVIKAAFESNEQKKVILL